MITTKTESIVTALKDAILNLQNEIELTIECWKDKPIKNINWNPKKTDWKK